MAGEFLAGDDGGGDGVTPTAFGRDDGAVAGPDPHLAPHFDRRHGETPERLHETEAGFLVVTQHMPRHRAADAGGEPQRLGLGN